MAWLLRLVLAIVVMSALAEPSSASAAHRSQAATVTPVALAKTVAGRYWGSSPCGGQIAVLTRQSLAAGLDPGSDAWVTFGTPLGLNNLAAPADGYTDCKVFLTSSRWPSRVSMRQDWDMLCMTMIHEYGHLLGHAHELTARSIMAPVFSDYRSEPQACRTAAR